MVRELIDKISTVLVKYMSAERVSVWPDPIADLSSDSVETLATGESEHADDPSFTAYIPRGQVAHALPPVLAVNLPEGQLVHTDAITDEYFPAAQPEHAELSVLDAGDDEPAGQLPLHSAAPMLAEYFPRGQLLQEMVATFDA